ncbi:von Willebrand factor A domain-containing protein 3B [Tupaia chinensis]|uniref:von Willebrand factor A domain-containing protein 3B n=1 Tax=Tupaia chinensis TaxID=246437 RepID=L8YB21_TUPCH|nr:von Willebrand factor A domain-containing protein 3B [Tupaia chinensis]
MEKSGSSSAASELQPRRQEGLSDTIADLTEQSLISSEKWLQLHGLKSNKLTLKQILSQIGFPHCEDYVTSLGRLVASRYADGLFPQFYVAEDNRVYNLTAKSELIYQFVDSLRQAVESYKQRMDWLTSKSRQIFGVILEQCVTIVLDLGGVLDKELDLCRDALVMVLQEQVAHITKFNIIWISQEPVKWQENATPVTEESITAAVSWLEKLTFEPTVSEVSSLDALLEAGRDTTIESIYYFVVGDVPEKSKELLLQRALEISHPVSTVSFNARGEGMIAFLKDLSAKTHGRFHAFAERTECVSFPAFPPNDGDSVMTWNSRKLKGKVPPGAGVREDVFLIWREMEEACSTLAQIQRLVDEPPTSDEASVDCESGATSTETESNPEDTCDSKKWLQKYGLQAQKLSFYDVLADCSFRHADGVVGIKAKPEDESVQTSAETKKKTVHAKYCSRFVHAPWKDGSLVHVNITKEKYKWYSERIHTALAQIQRRIKWLQAGSQILFGKVRDECVYVLIDTSHSMKSKLDLVKDKIIQLIQTGSSTNTLDALQIAFADRETQVIYLLTDGRPDQPFEMVMEQVKVYQKIPIYPISFNYNDEIANGFLRELASVTGGEFHFYNFGCKDTSFLEAVQQNEDLTLLFDEMEQGRSDLEKVQNLYSESLIMDWWYNGEKEGDNSSDVSSEDWLKVHGLVAKKLTLMDALSVTAVPHNSTYVPILDKHVVSKVFDEQEKLQGNPTKKTKSKKLDPLKGQKVIARCDENGFYFPGVVKKCVSPTHALVGFRYGDTKVVPLSFITPVGGAMPCPLLQVGDYVFAKIVTPKGFDFYVPAIVIALPNQDVASEKFYTVLKCNNRRKNVEVKTKKNRQKTPGNGEGGSTSETRQPPRKKRAGVDPTVENEEAFMNRVEVKDSKELKPWLVDDWDLITRQKQLLYLPKRNVDSILEDYANYKKSPGNTDNKEYAVNAVVAGIKEYFNVMLGSQLLYKLERPQCAEILAEHPDAPMSRVYGAPHLLRLFVRVGAMLACTPLDEKSLTLLLNYLHDFLKYLAKNSATLFSASDDEVAPPESHQKAM